MNKGKAPLVLVVALAAILGGCGKPGDKPAPTVDAKTVILKQLPCSQSQANPCNNPHPKNYTLKLQNTDGQSSSSVCVTHDAFDRYKPNDKFDVADEVACQ
jgi:hypothetical protein